MNAKMWHQAKIFPKFVRCHIYAFFPNIFVAVNKRPMTMKTKISLILTGALLLAAASCTQYKTPERDTLFGECTELGVVEYTGDLRFMNKPAKFEAFKPGPRVVLYCAEVHLKAGIDRTALSKVSVDASEVDRSVTVTLPKPTILSYKMEPIDVDNEYEKVGFFRWNFSNSEKLQIRQQAEQELMEQVKSPNARIPILKEAESIARTEVELLLKATGMFDTVTVIFKDYEKVS